MAKKTKEGEDLVASALAMVKEGLEVFVESDRDAEETEVGIFVSRYDPINAVGAYVYISSPATVNDYEAVKVSEFRDNALVASHFVVNNPENAEELATVITQFLGVREIEAVEVSGDPLPLSGHELMTDEDAAAEKAQREITSKAEKEGKI